MADKHTLIFLSRLSAMENSFELLIRPHRTIPSLNVPRTFKFVELFAGTFKEHFLGMFLELFGTSFKELFS